MTSKTNIWMKCLLAAAAAIALAAMAYGPAGSGPTGNPPPTHADATMPALLQGIFSETPPPDALLLPPNLRGLELSADQQARLLALMRKQAAQEREQFHSAFQALEALRQPSALAKFNSEKARTLANTYGQAVAQVVLIHAEFDARVQTLLSPEQRQELDAGRKRSEPGERVRE
jgi:Spy/CpxP family protein refolding chaperone